MVTDQASKVTFTDVINPITSLIDNIFGAVATSETNKTNKQINQDFYA